MALRTIAFLAASISLAALLGHVLLHVPMVYTLQFAGLPSLIVLLALGVYANRLHRKPLVNGIVVGTLGGFAATIGYDLIRYGIQASHPWGYNGFVPILLFGHWITGAPTGSLPSIIAGWVYHYWNGVSFGIMYVMIFANRHWCFGVAYGVVMELCMLGLFPLFIPIKNPVGFVLISLIGHVFYGAILGLVAQRYALPAKWRCE